MISYIIQYYFDIMKIICRITSYMKYIFLFYGKRLALLYNEQILFLLFTGVFGVLSI